MKIFLTLALFFVFTNHGYSDWEKCSNLPDNSQSLSLFMKTYDDVLYIGTVSGLHASKDNGDSWNLIGFKMRDVYDMEFVDDKFIAVTELGIFTSTDKGENWTGGKEGITDTIAQPCKRIYKCDKFILVTKKERVVSLKNLHQAVISPNQFWGLSGPATGASSTAHELYGHLFLYLWGQKGYGTPGYDGHEGKTRAHIIEAETNTR